MFGTTEDDLIAIGVDPNQYAKDHIEEALKNRKSREKFLKPSTRAHASYLKWAGRSYVFLFAALGFLFLSRISILHVWALYFGAPVAAGVAVAMYIYSIVLHVKWKREIRED